MKTDRSQTPQVVNENEYYVPADPDAVPEAGSHVDERLADLVEAYGQKSEAEKIRELHRTTEELLPRYLAASEEYYKHLEKEIIKQVDIFKQSQQYPILMIGHCKVSKELLPGFSSNRAAKMIVDRYINQDNSKVIIDGLTKSQPNLNDALQKIRVVNHLIFTLKYPHHAPTQKVEEFHKKLVAEKPVLIKCRDAGVTNFLKRLGFAVICLLASGGGMGIGAYFAAKKIFGDSSSRGGLFYHANKPNAERSQNKSAKVAPVPAKSRRS